MQTYAFTSTNIQMRISENLKEHDIYICYFTPSNSARSIYSVEVHFKYDVKNNNNNNNNKKLMVMYGFDFSLAASLRIYSGISLTPEDVSIVSVFVLSNSVQQPEKSRSLQATNNTLPERKGEFILTNVVLDSLGSSSCCFCSLLMQAGVPSLQGLICRK